MYMYIYTYNNNDNNNDENGTCQSPQFSAKLPRKLRRQI